MKLERDSLLEETNKIAESITSTAFLDQLEKVRRTPKEARISEAARRLTPDAMREAGVDLPEGVRISSRYFEEGDDYQVELGEVEGRIPVVPALEELKPGFLDELRLERPDLFKQLATDRIIGGRTVEWSVCACVGKIVCAGVGGGP